MFLGPTKIGRAPNGLVKLRRFAATFGGSLSPYRFGFRVLVLNDFDLRHKLHELFLVLLDSGLLA
jgi:hypothetical protein